MAKGQYLTLIEPQAAPFPWRFHDDEKNLTYDTVFTLRVLTEDEKDDLEQRYTRKVFNKKTRAYVDETDWTAYTRDALDLGIVDWQDLKNRAGQNVPCTRENKLALPGRVKAEINRVVLAREATDDVEETVAAGNGSAPISSGSPR